MNGVGYDQENRMILGWWNAKVAKLVVVVGSVLSTVVTVGLLFLFLFPLFLH
jgi:hypothetical protein